VCVCGGCRWGRWRERSGGRWWQVKEYNEVLHVWTQRCASVLPRAECFGGTREGAIVHDASWLVTEGSEAGPPHLLEDVSIGELALLISFYRWSGLSPAMHRLLA
jgi:hypothetical protein